MMNIHDIMPALALIGFLSIPLVGVAIRMGLRLAYGVRGPAPGDDLYAVINVVGWLFILVDLLILSLASLLSLFVLGFAIAGALLEYVSARRTLQREMAWGLVTSAQEKGLDVAEMVRLQGGRFSGRVWDDLRGFAWRLDKGDPLPTAIAVWHKAFPRKAQGYAALGKSDGRLATDGEMRLQSPSSNAAGAYGYLLWLLLMFGVLGAGHFMYILPAYEQIYNDFGMELPATTVALVQTAGVLDSLAILHFGFLLLLMSVVVAFFASFFYLFDVPVLEGLFDRLFFAQHRAQVLRLLATAAERQMTFDTAIGNLAWGHPRYPAGIAAGRLRKALHSTETGRDWKDALAGVRLLKRSEVPLLTAAEKAQNLPWAMRALADRISARSIFRWESLRQLAYPLIILLVGLVVMWYCVALFAPLVELIAGMT